MLKFVKEFLYWTIIFILTFVLVLFVLTNITD